MEQKSGFGLLFDLSFSEFLTTRIIRILFIVGIIFALLASLGLVVAGFSDSMLKGVFCLFFSPVVFLLYVIGARVWCELIIVVFRIAENTSRLVDIHKE